MFELTDAVADGRYAVGERWYAVGDGNSQNNRLWVMLDSNWLLFLQKMSNRCKICRHKFQNFQLCLENFWTSQPEEPIAILKPEIFNWKIQYKVFSYGMKPCDIKGGIESLVINEETYGISYKHQPEADSGSTSPSAKTQKCSVTPVKTTAVSLQAKSLFNSSDLDSTIPVDTYLSRRWRLGRRRESCFIRCHPNHCMSHIVRLQC